MVNEEFGCVSVAGVKPTTFHGSDGTQLQPTPPRRLPQAMLLSAVYTFIGSHHPAATSLAFGNSPMGIMKPA